MNRVATITYIQNKILLPIRYEVSVKPNTVREVRDSNSNDSHLLEWDANGNLQYYYFKSPEIERWHCWDEDNRLQATSDNHNTAFYQYGADGNRALKLSGESQQMSNNGNYHYFAQLNQVTLYPSPHIVVDNHGYTKHYYADNERICSRIGGGGIEGLYLPTDSVTAERLKHKPAENAMQAAQAGQCAMASVSVPSNTLGIMADMQTVQSAENDIYFVHSDHLGSASWVTNLSGQPIQHLQYLPYGESYIDQRSSSFHERYTFTGKEKDSESGYYYFGARYFMPNLSIWNSVDPMADKYPSLSPYNYCAWNPMKIIDPMGDSIILSKSAEAIHAKYYNKKGYEEYTNLYNKLNRDESVLFYFKEGNDNQYAKSQGSNGIIDYSETQLASYPHGCFDVEWGTPNDNYGGTIEHVYMEEFRHAGQIVEGDYKLSAASTIESEYNAKRFAIQNTRNRYSLYYDDNNNHIYSIPTELYIIDTYGPERAKQYLKYGIEVKAKDRDNNVINRNVGGHYNVFPIR